MRVGLYVRVSTDEQAKEGFSIDAQLRILNAWAVVKGADRITKYVDDGYSAKNLRRPGIKKMLADCRAQLLDVVIVWRLDRLSRSLRDTLAVLEDDFQENNVQFVSATENIDTSTPSGRLMLNVLASFAQNEREVTQERVKMVCGDLAKQCVHLGGIPPYGLTVTPDRRYEINESEAGAIRMLFGMYASGAGYSEILNCLESNGYKSRTGKPFAKNSLHDMLINEKYTGTYVYNRTIAASRNGRRNNHAAKSNDQVTRIPHAFPAIIDEVTWARVQQKMKENKRRGGSHMARRVYILSGLVYCGKCKRHMSIHNVGRNRDGSYQNVYACTDKCVKRIRYEKLDAFVIDYLRTLAADESLVTQAIEIANSFNDNVNDDIYAENQAIHAELDAISDRVHSICDYIAAEGANAPRALSGELHALESRQLELQTQLSANVQHVKVDASIILQKLRNAANLDKSSPEQQRSIIRDLIARVTVYDDDIAITLDSHADGGAEGGRTPVRRSENQSISERSLCFDIPSAELP